MYSKCCGFVPVWELFTGVKHRAKTFLLSCVPVKRDISLAVFHRLAEEIAKCQMCMKFG